MRSTSIDQLQEGDQIECFYAVQDANLLTTSGGKPYIKMRLGDATGSVGANMWDASAEIFNSFATGSVVKLRAVVETYRGSLQLKITALRPAHESEYDKADFLPTTSADIAQLRQDLTSTVESITDKDYRALMKSFFDDGELLDRFSTAPAAKENHHAYIGGLLEHTMSIVRLCDAFCSASSTPINRNLLLAGALLHDIGKIDELGAETSIEYTDVGKLIGHLVIGTMMVEKHASEIPDFPDEKKFLVMHMILSHHGKREYGSPVLPAIPEALALHHIDNLDAKTVAARRLIDADSENDRAWTDRSWMLDTQLYKSSLPCGEGHVAPSVENRPAPETAKPKPETGSLFG